jgi:hypothetical protein
VRYFCDTANGILYMDDLYPVISVKIECNTCSDDILKPSLPSCFAFLPTQMLEEI